jgi:hypothetical protein
MTVTDKVFGGTNSLSTEIGEQPPDLFSWTAQAQSKDRVLCSMYDSFFTVVTAMLSTSPKGSISDSKTEFKHTSGAVRFALHLLDDVERRGLDA